MTSNPCRLIDTHCHLDFAELDSLRPEILLACAKQGVEQIVIPGVVSRHWRRILNCVEDVPHLHAALGLHPGFVPEHRPEDLLLLERLLSEHPVVAVGEIGLDAWRGREELEAQLPWFEAQLHLASRFNLPVILHVRKAHDQVLKYLRRQRLARGGVVHAFSGSRQQAEQYLAVGFKLGVGGALTYPRAQRLRHTMAELPVEGLVLETDAPDMPLLGYQGQMNRPDRLPMILAVLAELRGSEASALAERLYVNSCELFGLPRAERA